MSIKIFGSRVALKPVQAQYDGVLQLPQNRNKAYELGEVVYVGNGVYQDRVETMFVSPGDTVLVQFNPVMMANNIFKRDGGNYLVILQGDIIAKVTSTLVKLENFKVISNWVLVEIFQDQQKDSLIITPDTVKDSDHASRRYRVIQKGESVSEIEVGNEVLVDPLRGNPIRLDGIDYLYVDKNYIYGIVY